MPAAGAGTELERLAKLHTQGLITEAEYQVLRDRLLLAGEGTVRLEPVAKPAVAVPRQTFGTGAASGVESYGGEGPYVVSRRHLVKGETVAAEWVLPSPAQVLAEHMPRILDDGRLELHRSKIDEMLGAFGIPAQVAEVKHGPAFTQYLVGVAPEAAMGRKRVSARVIVNQIADLADDLAVALSGAVVRVLSPVPGTVFASIEVAKQQRLAVPLVECIDTPEYRAVKSPLALVLGQDAAGRTVCADLATLPHLWIVGPSGSGTSTCLNSIIAGLLMANTPDQLRLLALDAVRVELGRFNGLPHLLAPVVTDPERALKSVQWVVRELENRYRKFADEGVRNLAEFNRKAAAKSDAPLANWVVAIDGLAQLVNAESSGLEAGLLYITSRGQAVGVHLVVATHPQGPRASKSGLQAGFPARIEFAVVINERTQERSSTRSGAQASLMRGEMQFVSAPAAIPLRAQCGTISDTEIDNLTSFWRKQDRAREADKLRKLGLLTRAQSEELAVASKPVEATVKPAAGSGTPWDALRVQQESVADRADLIAQASVLAKKYRTVSARLFQRKLKLGYPRAARLMDELEKLGVVGREQSGDKTREVLLHDDDDVLEQNGVVGPAAQLVPAAPPAVPPVEKATENAKDGNSAIGCLGLILCGILLWAALSSFFGTVTAPAPTPTPIPTVIPFSLIAPRWEEYKDEILSKNVDGWYGWVSKIRVKSGQTEISIDLDAPDVFFSDTEIVLLVSNSVAEGLLVDDSVRFSGIVSKADKRTLAGVSLWLDNARVERAVAPRPTATRTSAPTATAVPTHTAQATSTAQPTATRLATGTATVTATREPAPTPTALASLAPVTASAATKVPAPTALLTAAPPPSATPMPAAVDPAPLIRILSGTRRPTLPDYELSRMRNNGLKACGSNWPGRGEECSNESEARNWFQLAGDAGDTVSMVLMGDTYCDAPHTVDTCEGVIEARQWYQRAVDAGDAVGAVYMGHTYCGKNWGLGVTCADLLRGRQWFRAGAEAGDSYAMYLLGDTYLCPNWWVDYRCDDLSDMHYWYSRSADAGNVYGTERFGIVLVLEGRLSEGCELLSRADATHVLSSAFREAVCP